MRRPWLASLVCAFAAAGCSGDPGMPSSDDALITCTGDPRAQSYSANMQQMGIQRALRFVLVQSDPAPPEKGNNAWTVKLQDAAGAPVAGAMMTAKPFMPDHGHGTSVVPQVTDMGGGAYAITPLYLFMAGLWTITLNAQANPAPDSTVFSFCIEG